MIKAVFQVSKSDKVKVSQSFYKKRTKDILDILFNFAPIKKSKVFNYDISKIKFSIVFCSNQTIQRINKEYRSKDKVTDVITFSLFCDDDNPIVYRKTADLGEIYISVERADEQKQNSLEEEITTLICHGILHLLGFDHLTEKDYDFVVKTQNMVIKKLGI